MTAPSPVGEPGEIGPAEHDVQQFAAAVGDVARPESVKRDYAHLVGHFRHVSKPLRYVW